MTDFDVQAEKLPLFENDPMPYGLGSEGPSPGFWLQLVGGELVPSEVAVRSW